MYIASASSVVKFHDFPGNHLVHTYQPIHKVEGACRSLSWTKDGSWIAVVPYTGSTEIVTLKGQCKLLHTVNDVSEPSCASFQNLTKRNIAVGTKHGQVLLYDIKSRNIKARYPRTSSAITHVGFTAKDTHCYAGCANGDVLLFNNVAKNLSCTLKVPKSHSLTAVKAHTLKRNFLIGGSNEGIICVWDVNVNKIKFQTEAHSGPITSAIFSPVNAALIVSAGLDRLVRVFDIENQSRITTIPVENNILSLDFVADSMYIVMGAQNGKIHIYDTRSLQDPVISYDAHKSAVKHLAYQNSSDENMENNSSLSSMVSEEPGRRISKSNEEVQANKKRTSDFFGILVEGPSSISETFDDGQHNQTSSLQSAGGDSFMKALGLDENNTMDSLKDASQQEEVDFSKPKVRLSLNKFTPNPAKTVHDKFSLYDSKSHNLQPTSTPKFPSQNFLTSVSPIISALSSNQNNGNPGTFPCASLTEIQTATKDAIQGEVKQALEEMETKITYQFMNHAHQIRRMVLDLHMATLKEFIKVENYCNIIRDEINSEPASNRESCLLEENISLKKKIQELENQIANLASGDNSTSNE